MFESDDEYYADREFLTNSSLKMLHKSPTLFYMWLNKKGENYSSNALEVGKAFHAISLEDKEIFVGYEGTRRGKDYMSFCEQNSDKIILSKKDADMLYRMNDKLRKCPEACDLLYNGGKAEVPATGEWDGIKIKGKADLVVDVDFSPGFLVDVKTTGSDISDFARQAPYFGYHQQSAVYSKLFGVKKFYFVVITKSFPYDVGVYECSPEFIERGAEKAQQAINKYKQLFIENEFNPYSAAEIKLL